MAAPGARLPLLDLLRRRLTGAGNDGSGLGFLIDADRLGRGRDRLGPRLLDPLRWPHRPRQPARSEANRNFITGLGGNLPEPPSTRSPLLDQRDAASAAPTSTERGRIALPPRHSHDRPGRRRSPHRLRRKQPRPSRPVRLDGTCYEPESIPKPPVTPAATPSNPATSTGPTAPGAMSLADDLAGGVSRTPPTAITGARVDCGVAVGSSYVVLCLVGGLASSSRRVGPRT